MGQQPIGVLQNELLWGTAFFVAAEEWLQKRLKTDAGQTGLKFQADSPLRCEPYFFHSRSHVPESA
jgi:hypothetical protein